MRGPFCRSSGLLLRLLGLAGCLALGSGCILTGPREYVHNGFKVGPNYSPPPAPVADDWIEADAPNVQRREPADWWRVFNDPSLDALIAIAREQNLTLRAAGSRILQARAQWAIAVGNIGPQTQEATGRYSRVNLSRNMAN